MAAAFSSSTAIARMAVEGAPAWDLATLMPDGAVGASASGGGAVVLAQEFADEHRGRIGGYDATAMAKLCADLERVQEALTVSYALERLAGFDRFAPVGGPPSHVGREQARELVVSSYFSGRPEDVLTLGEAFVASYLELLAAGGSRSPQRLGEMVGVDLSAPGFWATGLELINRNLDEPRDVSAATAV